jgi:hypothetical protein
LQAKTVAKAQEFLVVVHLGDLACGGLALFLIFSYNMALDAIYGNHTNQRFLALHLLELMNNLADSLLVNT